MAKDVKEAKEVPEVKKPQTSGTTENSCGCRCVPLVKAE